MEKTSITSILQICNCEWYISMLHFSLTMCDVQNSKAPRVLFVFLKVHKKIG